jgi:LuxR family maltose regulon positive regulatory protein
VARTRLDDAYSRGTGRVVRVLAPAGYGKSTLVARWAAHEHREVRWLDVEPTDDDPVALLGSLDRVLADLLGRRLTEGGAGPIAADRTSASRLRAAVAATTTPFVLVLDDVHLVTDPAALDLVRAVAAGVPAVSTVVLAGRAHHDADGVAALRLSPGVVDLTTEHLAFDLAETEEMLVAGGLSLDVADLTLLDEQFEGWPAALRLAGLVLAAPGGRRAPTSLADAGELTDVTDYLTAEWLGGLDQDDRRFLMEAACLGHFTAGMCDDVLDRRGSAATIRRLDRDRLVVLPLDRRGDWYRMHALLHRWLCAELRSEDRERWRQVHRRASEWWEQRGDVDLALEHLGRADELDRYEELVVEHSVRVITHGRSATVRRWLSALPPDRVRRSPGLWSVEAMQATASGDGARALRWSRLLQTASSPDLGAAPQPWAARVDIIRAMLEPRPVAEVLPLALRAKDASEPGPWRAYACLTLGGLLALAGDDLALDVLAEGIDEGVEGDAPTMGANCLALAAILLDLDGDHVRAAAMGARAVDIIRDMRFEHVQGVAGTVVAVRALAAARAGDRDTAAADVARVRQILRGYEGVGPWYNVLARLPLVRASLLVHDPATATTLLREVEHHLRFEPPGGRIAGCVADLRARAEAARHVDARSSSLTGAELRVVRYLPTNLSLADIAERLYVSRNTVKSHTSSIYRKLGTASRREAVELARAAGLLEDGDL